MCLFPDGRVCQRCGGPMEVHVDYHCQRCGWKPGDSTKRPPERSAEEVLREMLGEADPGPTARLKKEDPDAGDE